MFLLYTRSNFDNVMRFAQSMIYEEQLDARLPFNVSVITIFISFKSFCFYWALQRVMGLLEMYVLWFFNIFFFLHLFHTHAHFFDTFIYTENNIALRDNIDRKQKIIASSFAKNYFLEFSWNNKREKKVKHRIV